MTIKDFCEDNRSASEYIFVRPQHDTKSLVGQVWTAGEFKKWCQEAKLGSYAEVNGDTPIVVATPYGIDAEWRLFIVDNQIISASQYHKAGRLFKSQGAPDGVLKFAQTVMERWNPAPAYVLDICESAKNYYIMEVQGFNSAGHYAADINKVVCAVNDLTIKLWHQKRLKII